MGVAAFSGGNGTQSNPYQITTCQELQEIEDYSTNQMHFVLNNNINCSGINFNPIGTDKGSTIYMDNGSPIWVYGFNGVLEGNNFEIQYLTISDKNIAGLFGHVNPLGIIKNIKLKNHNITGNIVVGSLAGSNSGFISNVHSTGNIYLKIPLTQTEYGRSIGGLVGENYFFTATPNLTASKLSGLIINSSSQGNVAYSNSLICDEYSNPYGEGGGLAGFNTGTIINSNSSGQINLPCNSTVGGLVGYNLFGNLFNNYSTKTVTGLNEVGGLIGRFDNNNTNSILFNYYNGTVTAKKNMVGGLIGRGNGGKIAYNYSLGNINSNENPGNIGGLIGELYSTDLYPDIYTNLYNNYSKSYIPSYYNGLYYIGGLIGNATNGIIYNNYYGGSSQIKGISAGGFIGEVASADIYNNYSLADVAANSNYTSNYCNIGGFIGILHNGTNIKNNFSLGSVTKSTSTAVHYMGGFIGYLKQPIDTTNNWWLLGGFNKIGKCLNSDGSELSTCDNSNSVNSKGQFTSNNTFGPYPNWNWQTTQEVGDWIIDNCGINSNYPILSFQVNGACGAASYFDLRFLDWQNDNNLLCARGNLKQGSLTQSEDGLDVNWICESPNKSCGGLEVNCKNFRIPFCGDGVIDEGENCSNCPEDVICQNDYYYEEGICIKDELDCSSDGVCNEDCPIWVDLDCGCVSVDGSCVSNSDCCRGLVCGAENKCVSTSSASASINVFNLFVDGNKLYYKIKCNKEVPIDINLYKGEVSSKNLVSVDDVCEVEEKNGLILDSVEEKIIYTAIAKIQPICKVCTKTDYLVVEDLVNPTNVPDNSIIFVLITLIGVIFLLNKTNKK